jgi:hypothetical protein
MRRNFRHDHHLFGDIDDEILIYSKPGACTGPGSGLAPRRPVGSGDRTVHRSILKGIYIESVLDLLNHGVTQLKLIVRVTWTRPARAPGRARLTARHGRPWPQAGRQRLSP